MADRPRPFFPRVEEVVSPKGIRAYLVTERSVPFLTLALHFRAGAVLDPPDRCGLATMVAGLLDEGAGPYDSQAFRRELEDNAIRLTFDADLDGFTGTLKTLTATRDHAFDLLRLALLEPRFDPEPIERIRSQIQAELRRRESDPDYVSARAWYARAFDGHGYGRPVRGTLETIARIRREDLVGFARERLARADLAIGVAGDIGPEELAVLLDRTFGGLPERSAPVEPPPTEPRLGDTVLVPMPIPQSVVTFGRKGIARNDPDYYAATIANYILGGGGFSSRLMQEVREKRGLAYSVYTYLADVRLAPLWLGAVATSNERVARSIALVREEVARLAEGEIDDRELADAKTYLTGSFPLRLATNDQLARMLLGMMVHGLGRDYLERRNELVSAVGPEDLRRVCRRLYAGPLLVAVAGRPEGLE
ncbi:MAG: insulinase family protein [Geminicoccaceae bacterium]|nr:insulinase family protein [Geminicoccaceae bacterium]MCS7267803.1 insulinase family protein [Geminicoccaceae bacterium]MCX7630082.1 insulinase family protein [Geminicoccaceae bacterium]MDW8124357.1 pitrilysin family protein [Geminicoccaceae bacterium]MDW8341826.1 pitrilysin family protein [Geminicoccaceae bacterium]